MKSSLEILPAREATLSEVLDRILDKGVVISGDLILSVADIDLVYCGLRLVICSVDKLGEMTGVNTTEPTNQPRP